MYRMCLILLGCVISAASLAAGEPGVKKSIAYVQKLQTETGGFLSQSPAPNIRIAPTVRATSSAARTLHYLGSEVPNKDAASKFIDSCFDPQTGGFSDMPKGKPDVATTAIGLMAVVELKMPTEKYSQGATKYLSDHAKSFEEIRIAVAGFEAIKQHSSQERQWLDEVIKSQNNDGTFGKGAGAARATGGSVVALMRLGLKLPRPDAILKTLKDGQRQNGGWGKEDSDVASDLETTYRVMRCFVMLKAKPAHVEGVRSFVAKCRNEDGGYGVAPGQTSSVSGSYYAAIITLWLKDQK